MASGCPLPPPHGPKPRTVGTQLDRSVCGVRVASPIRRSGDRRDEKRPRFSRLAWQIPRCDSPAFRFSGRQQLALRGRPRRCAARPAEPAGPPSPARLVYGCSAGKQPRVVRLYSAADLGRRRAQVLERGAHTPGRPSRRTAPRLAGLRERLGGRLRETLLDQPKGGQDGRPESDAGCQGAKQSEIELGRLGATGGRYKAAPHGLGSTNRDGRARHASSFRVLSPHTYGRTASSSATPSRSPRHARP